jgi:hypothetical protein
LSHVHFGVCVWLSPTSICYNNFIIQGHPKANTFSTNTKDTWNFEARVILETVHFASVIMGGNIRIFCKNMWLQDYIFSTSNLDMATSKGFHRIDRIQKLIMEWIPEDRRDKWRNREEWRLVSARRRQLI